MTLRICEAKMRMTHTCHVSGSGVNFSEPPFAPSQPPPPRRQGLFYLMGVDLWKESWSVLLTPPMNWSSVRRPRLATQNGFYPVGSPPLCLSRLDLSLCPRTVCRLVSNLVRALIDGPPQHRFHCSASVSYRVVSYLIILSNWLPENVEYAKRARTKLAPGERNYPALQ